MSKLPKTNVELTIPNHLDKDIIYRWIPDGSYIFRQMTDINDINANYCVAFSYDEIFSFARFFKIGEITHCSVDFQSNSRTDMIEKVIDLLEDKFSF